MKIRALVAIIALAFLMPLLAAPEDALEQAAKLRQAGEFEEAQRVLQDALEAEPAHPEMLLEMGRIAYWQALEILGGMSPALGALALVDAIEWLKKAVAADPENAAPLKLLGEVALAASDFETAADAYRHAAALDPRDGESRYQQGFALGYLRRFEEAIRAFEAAEQILGPDPRVLLNRGISHLSLEDVPAAERYLVRTIDVEADAGRTSSQPILSAWTWLWRLNAKRGGFARAEEIFLGLTERHPDLSGAFWYLAHARQERGDHAGAAAAYARVTELTPDFAPGWQKLGEARIAAGDFEGAEQVLDRLLGLDGEGEGPRELLLAVARGLAAKSRPEEALALLTRKQDSFPTDPWVLEARGDLHFGLGQFAGAVKRYREAVENDPFAAELAIKEQKAATALLLEGGAPEDLLPLRPEAGPETPGGSGGPICDFEGSQVFARVNGRAEGSREGGVFFLRRTGAEGSPTNLGLTLMPTLDVRPFSSLTFDVLGPEGTVLTVWAKDCYDQFEVTAFFTRLRHSESVGLSGEWRTVTLSLAGFDTVLERRPIPMNHSRLRMILFEIGQKAGEGKTLPGEIRIDNVKLTGPDGLELLLADFDGDPSEVAFLSTGAAMAFAPTLFVPEQLSDFRPDPNTFVSPGIMGEEFDPATVHGGEGSYRLTLVREGAASGVVTFNPDRSYDRATALVFWARGMDGGEKVRVTVRDALDDDLKNTRPAVAPRLMAGGTLLEGWFVLSTEWKKFRISRSELPDVDFRSLAEIRFHFGADCKNDAGTTIYLDDIAWE